MKKLVFENGIELALPSIKVTKKNADIGTPGGVFVGVTNVFSLPFTHITDQILGLARKVESISNAPYQISNVTLMDDDQPLILNGRMVLVRSKDSYEIVVIDLNTTFFDRIKDLYINDLEPDDANCYGGLDATTIAARITATDYMVSPVMKWGEIDTAAACVNIKRATYLPCFYYHTILTLLLTAMGVTSCLTYPEGMETLVVPMGRSSYRDSLTNKFPVKATKTTSQSALLEDEDQMDVQFNDSIIDNVGGYFNGTKYIVPDTLNYNVKLKVTAQITFTYTAGTGNIIVGMVSDPSFNGYLTSGTYTVNLEHEYIVGKDSPQEIYVYVIGIGIGHTVNVVSGKFSVEVAENSITDTINYLGYLPDLKATDLLADYMARHFLSAKEENNNLCSKEFNSIASGVELVDWTTRRSLKVLDEITYKDDRFGQINIMQYANSLGRGTFEIENRNLVESKTFFTSVFNTASEEFVFTEVSGNVLGTRMAALNVIPLSGDENTIVDTPLTLLNLRPQSSGDPPIKFEGVTKTTYFVAYFDDPNYKSMAFQRFINDYGTSFVNALKRYKYIGRYYNLNTLDILLFDSFKLVMDDGILYYVDDIIDFETNLPTRVNLLKLE